jgi:hypothetical protein
MGLLLVSILEIILLVEETTLPKENIRLSAIIT